jgi:WD40 repeat protein
MHFQARMMTVLTFFLADAAALPAQALKERFTLRDPEPPFACVALSPDGVLLAAGLRRYDRKLNKRSGVIRIWDVAGGKERATLIGHSDGVSALAFSPDGKALASCCQGSPGTVKVWDVGSWKALREFQVQSLSRLALAFSPDGKRLAHFCGQSALWDVDTGRELGPFTPPLRLGAAAAFSPDLKTLAAANHQDVDLWDIEARKERGSLLDHRGWVNQLAFTADGRTLAAVTYRQGDDYTYHGEVKFWDVAAGRERARLKEDVRFIRCMALTPDGKLLVTAGSKNPNGHHELKVIDTTTGRHLAEVSLAEEGQSYALAFSRDSRLLVAGTTKVLKVWDVSP